MSVSKFKLVFYVWDEVAGKKIIDWQQIKIELDGADLNRPYLEGPEMVVRLGSEAEWTEDFKAKLAEASEAETRVREAFAGAGNMIARFLNKELRPKEATPVPNMDHCSLISPECVRVGGHPADVVHDNGVLDLRDN